ncbi:TPA: hypothetical protein ACH3X2_012986 [Trebouxia sp. C0005]
MAAPRRSGRQHEPATEYWKKPPPAPEGLIEPLQTPLSTASASQCQWAARKAEAGDMMEGAGPTAPWDCPSFWAAGRSASRGVALLFKACPLLSGSQSMLWTPVADLLPLEAA